MVSMCYLPSITVVFSAPHTQCSPVHHIPNGLHAVLQWTTYPVLSSTPHTQYWRALGKWTTIMPHGPVATYPVYSASYTQWLSLVHVTVTHLQVVLQNQHNKLFLASISVPQINRTVFHKVLSIHVC